VFVFSIFMMMLLANNPAPGTLVDVGGFKLHAQVMGSGEPTVVLLAGAGNWSSYWALVQPALAKHTRVVSYDSQGTGWSDFGPADRGLNQDAYELAQLLKGLKIDGPLILVGHSLGGLVAHTFAVRYPERVRGVVFVDSSTPDLHLNFRDGDTFKWDLYRNKAKGKPLPPIQEKRLSPQNVTETKSDRDPGDLSMFSAEVQGHFRAIFARSRKDVLKQKDWVADELAEMHAHPEQFKLGSLPVRVMSGDAKDRYSENMPERVLWHEQATAYLMGLSTKSHLISVKKSGHNIHLDEPELVVNTVLSLFRELSPAK